LARGREVSFRCSLEQPPDKLDPLAVGEALRKTNSGDRSSGRYSSLNIFNRSEIRKFNAASKNINGIKTTLAQCMIRELRGYKGLALPVITPTRKGEKFTRNGTPQGVISMCTSV
jgi:hypothetical protein